MRKRILGSVAASIRDRFVDTFNRSDSASSLGTASDGSLWTALRGSLGISSNKAVLGSGQAASGYPAATVKMPKTNVTISESGVGNGSGALLWATDSNNWWATDIYQSTFSVTNYTTNFAGNYTCTAWTTNYICAAPFYCCNVAGYTTGGAICIAWNSNNIKNAAYCRTYTRNYTINYTCSTCCNSFYTAVNCSSGIAQYNTTATGTTYYYPTYIRIMQSVANVVSQITNAYLGDNLTIQGLRTITSGNQITVRAFSDANLTTQVGSDLVYTATGATVTAEYGIILTPSDSNSVNSIDSITIE